MDITNTFKSEVFKPVVITLIPGGLAILPYVLCIYLSSDALKEFFELHQLAIAVTYVLCAIAIGMIIEDFGSRVEVLYDKIIDGKAGSTHNADWDKFLKTSFDPQPIGLAYVEIVVMRFKFELSFSISLIIAIIGFAILNHSHNIVSGGIQFYIILTTVLLVSYLLYEAYSAAKLLGRTRALLLQGINKIT